MTEFKKFPKWVRGDHIFPEYNIRSLLRHIHDTEKAKEKFVAQLESRLQQIYDFNVEEEMERINDTLAQNDVTSLSKRDIEEQALENIETEMRCQFEGLLKEILEAFK